MRKIIAGHRAPHGRHLGVVWQVTNYDITNYDITEAAHKHSFVTTVTYTHSNTHTLKHISTQHTISILHTHTDAHTQYSCSQNHASNSTTHTHTHTQTSGYQRSAQHNTHSFF